MDTISDETVIVSNITKFHVEQFENYVPHTSEYAWLVIKKSIANFYNNGDYVVNIYNIAFGSGAFEYKPRGVSNTENHSRVSETIEKREKEMRVSA